MTLLGPIAAVPSAPIRVKLMVPNSPYSSAIPNRRKAADEAANTKYLAPASSGRGRLRRYEVSAYRETLRISRPRKNVAK